MNGEKITQKVLLGGVPMEYWYVILFAIHVAK